jgi:hypothetical protein
MNCLTLNIPQADPTLTTQMKSVGEAMAIGRTFKESLQECLRSPPERGSVSRSTWHPRTSPENPNAPNWRSRCGSQTRAPSANPNGIQIHQPSGWRFEPDRRGVPTLKKGGSG